MHKMKKPLEFNQFGADNGQIVVYFHGVPGAPEEGVIFDACGKEHGLTFICYDRFSVDPTLIDEAYYRYLAKEISRKSAGRKVDVIGFSIGAFIALQTCRHMGNEVRRLHLISAAAPLETGDFLAAMAGKQVFQLAKTFPALFVFLSYWQSLLAWFFPNALFRLLFASVSGQDKALAADKAFQSGIIKVLRSCFIGRVLGYARDVKAYVRPWKTTLSEISVNTHIWHGAEDNWSPSGMATYLESAIPGCASTRIFDGLSHYSCLYQATPEICNLLARHNIAVERDAPAVAPLTFTLGPGVIP
jgi:pimeloyl-ACP methyl ester carboxylesterase